MRKQPTWGSDTCSVTDRSITAYGHNIIQWNTISLYHMGLITDKEYSIVDNQNN